MRKLVAGMVAVVLGVSSSYADIMVTADPDYDAGAPVFTLDPELFGPAARNLAATRQLRQTFQNGSTFDVGEIILSLNVQTAASGIGIEIFEVADVNAGSWAPLGAALATIAVPSSSMVTTSARLGVTLSGGDVFTLLQRDTGAEGYGIQLSVEDAATNVGAWRHSNDGTNHYTEGVYYSESGSIPNSARDMGVNLLAIPEPSVAVLLLGGFGLVRLLRRKT